MFFRFFWLNLVTLWILKAVVIIGYQDRGLSQHLNPSPAQQQSLPFLLPPRPQNPVPLPQKPSSPFQPPLDNLDNPPLIPPLPSGDLPLPQKITITRFKFEGNTAFSDGELAQILTPFTNKPITFAQLLEAEAAITQYYVNAGYINSGAIILTGQVFKPDDAIVQVTVIEGGVEAIQVTVEGRLNPNYVRKRLAIATQTPLNQNRLLEALQVLQLNPLIETISADLSAGSRPESSILSVTVKEADTFNLEIFANNSRVPSIGSFERGIVLNQDNFFGIGDGLQIEYANTDGSNAIYGNYTIPVNPYNGKVQLTAQGTASRLIEPPFDQLNIKGDSLYLDLSFRQPIIQTSSQEFALGVTFSRSASKTRLFDRGFPLSPGANNQGETRISALRWFQEWTQRGSQDVLLLRSQFSFGLDIFDATINNDSPDSQFFEWQGQGQYVRSLASDTLLVLRSSVQLTTDPLVPLEQFPLGGLYSVRGYRQDWLLTDNGVFASAEVRLPLLQIDEVQGLLQIAPFIDFGVAWNDRHNPLPSPTPNTLIGVGLGLQWQMDNNFTTRFDWGIPLIEVDSGDRTLQEKGFYFTVNYRFL